MPLDGADFVIPAQHALDAAAAEIGIRPVPPGLLDRHKDEQRQRHRAGWAYHYRRSIELALAGVMVAGVLGFFVMFSAHLALAGSIAGVVGLAAAVGPMLVPVRGPAHWRERAACDLRDVHPAVRERAQRLQRQLPEVGFVLGELYQERVKLDPYLVAELDGARIVLGIWDDDRLIACA